MKTLRQTHGQLGEEATVTYLKRQGYRILERNHKSPLGEIDIIAQKKGVVHIIEVKSSSREMYAEFRPEQNLRLDQARRLLRSAEAYLVRAHYPLDQEWQIDLATVEFRLGGEPIIQHYERAIVG